jgi:hypothetical protein
VVNRRRQNQPQRTGEAIVFITTRNPQNPGLKPGLFLSLKIILKRGLIGIFLPVSPYFPGIFPLKTPEKSPISSGNQDFFLCGNFPTTMRVTGMFSPFLPVRFSPPPYSATGGLLGR